MQGSSHLARIISEFLHHAPRTISLASLKYMCFMKRSLINGKNMQYKMSVMLNILNFERDIRLMKFMIHTNCLYRRHCHLNPTLESIRALHLRLIHYCKSCLRNAGTSGTSEVAVLQILCFLCS